MYADIASSSELFNPEGRKLFAAYVKKFGTPLSNEHFVSLSFLSYAALIKAIESGSPVKEFLYEHRLTELADGYSFDDNEDIVSDRISYVLHIVRDGAPARPTNLRTRPTEPFPRAAFPIRLHLTNRGFISDRTPWKIAP